SILGIASLCTYAQDTVRMDATLQSVTVYFGYGAELTHEGKTRVSPSTKYVVINKLSTNLDVNSLQISCPESVALLSHRYEVYYPSTPAPVKSREVIRLSDSIELLKKQVGRIGNNIAIEKEKLLKTGLLIEGMVGSKGDKPVSSAELVRLIEFYNAGSERATTDIDKYELEMAERQTSSSQRPIRPRETLRQS